MCVLFKFWQKNHCDPYYAPTIVVHDEPTIVVHDIEMFEPLTSQKIYGIVLILLNSISSTSMLIKLDDLIKLQCTLSLLL